VKLSEIVLFDKEELKLGKLLRLVPIYPSFNYHKL
jgi:hypothetical protein